VAQALDLTNQDIADFLGGLPPEKMHCSVMGYEALRAAIANYRGEEWHDDHEEGALICKCFGVDEGMLERAIRSNKLTSVEMVTYYTKAGGSCATCIDGIEDTLMKVNAAMAVEGLISAEEAFVIGKVARPVKKKAATVQISPLAPKAPAATKPVLTMVQKIKAVEAALEELRPFLKADGGDCELVDIDGDKVMVKLSGACVGCQMASVTIAGVQEKLIEKLGIPLKVIPVKGH
jgi:NifU-like protein